jgi:hypothetical protein
LCVIWPGEFVDRDTRLTAASQGIYRVGSVREPAGDAERVWAGRRRDVDYTWGKLVKLRANVNCHVLSARQALVAVAAAGVALSEALLSAARARR